MLTRVAAGAFALGCLIAPFQPAQAEEPVETAIREWVSSINASPDWRAGYRKLSYDAADGHAVLSGLTIQSEEPGVTIGFENVAIFGFRETSDGGFSAQRITADGGAGEFGAVKVALADVEVNELAIPAMPAIAWDAQHPFTSLIRAYAPLTRVAMTNGRIGSATLLETNNGVTSRITYNAFRIDRWSGGKIAAVTAGPLTMEAPDTDGLLTMKVASFETRDLDMDAALRVLDPDRYAGGAGDGVWHSVSGVSAYRNMTIDGPGLKMTLNLVSAEDLRMRQPAQSFAGLIDKLMLDPNYEPDSDEDLQAVVAMVSCYGVGRIGISGLDVTATGIEGIHLGGFNISDLSVDRLGEFAINDFGAAVADQGSLRIGHFALGNMVLPGAEGLLAAIRAEAAGEEVDPAAVMPKLGFLEASGVEFEAVDVPRTTLNSLRLDLADYVGVVPTSVVAAMNGLKLPVKALDAEARAVFARLGIDEADVSYRMNANWRESDETLTVNDLQFDLKGAGGLGLSMVLAGLPREAIANPEALQDVLPDLTLSKAEITLRDDSIVGKGLDMLAEKMHAPPEKFRQQFADAMPLLLSLFVLKDPQTAALVRKSGLLATLAPVVKAFVASPGSSISVSLAPPHPLALPAIAGIATQAPEALIETLGFSVSSTGTLPGGGGPGGATRPAPPANAPLAPSGGGASGGGLRGQPQPTTPAQ